ncbi:hypothetical protein Tco_0401507 [Tanacetum coccineum]
MSLRRLYTTLVNTSRTRETVLHLCYAALDHSSDARRSLEAVAFLLDSTISNTSLMPELPQKRPLCEQHRHYSQTSSELLKISTSLSSTTQSVISSPRSATHIYKNNTINRDCMTRSSAKELLSPFENPEQKFCSKRRLFDTPSLVESNSLEFDHNFDIEEQSEEG